MRILKKKRRVDERAAREIPPRKVGPTNDEMLKEIKEALERMSTDRLAWIWCELNTWEWPNEVPHKEDADAWKGYHSISETRRNKTMDWIRNEVGEREIHKAWMKMLDEDAIKDGYKSYEDLFRKMK